MKTILKAMVKMGLNFDDQARKQDYRLFSVLSQRLNEGEWVVVQGLLTFTDSLECSGELSSELALVMQRLWNDTGVQKCVKRSGEYGLNDSGMFLCLSVCPCL